MGLKEKLLAERNLRLKERLPYYDSFSASDSEYDNTISGLASDNVQSAIDELASVSPFFDVVLAAITPQYSLFTLNTADQAVIVTSDTNNLDFNEIVGMTLVAGALGATVDAVHDKVVIEDPAWTWVPNGTLYLDSTGTISQTQPTTGTFIPLGYAITATKIWFEKGAMYRPEVENIEVGVNVTAGRYVNIYNDAGTLKVRHADAMTVPPRPAHGYVLSTVAAGSGVLVYYTNSVNPALAGLTIGDTEYLTTAGQVANTPPGGAGTISQQLGQAVSATAMRVDIQQPLSQVDNYDWVVLGNTVSGHVKGRDCDFDENDIATTIFSNCNLVIKVGDYTASGTLQLAGDLRLFQNYNALLGTVNLANGTVLKGNLDCDNLTVTAAGSARIVGSLLDISTSINTATLLTVINSKSIANIPAVTGSITFQNTYCVGNIGNVSSILRLRSSYVDGSIGTSGAISVLDSRVQGSVGNSAGTSTYELSYVEGSIGTTGTTLTIHDATVDGNVGNIGTALDLKKAFISGTVGTLGASSTIDDSFIGSTLGATTGSLTINKSEIEGAVGNISINLTAWNSVFKSTVGTVGGNAIYQKCKVGGNVGAISNALTLDDSSINGNVGNIALTLTMDHSKIGGTLATTTGDATIRDSYIGGNATAFGANLTLSSSEVQATGNITGNLTSTMAKLAVVGTIGGNLSLTATAVSGAIGNVAGLVTSIDCALLSVGSSVGLLTLFKTKVTSGIGNITGNINIDNSDVGSNIGTVSGSATIKNSYTGPIGVIGGNVGLTNSYVGRISEIQGGTLSLSDSSLNRLDSTFTLLKITSKNSYVRIDDVTANISLTSYSDLTIYFPLAASQAITFGDGTAPNDFTDCIIKILANEQGGFALTMNDNPSGVGTIVRNVSELYFGNSATFNVSGGATNILKRTGRAAGITDTAMNYTVVNDVY